MTIAIAILVCFVSLFGLVSEAQEMDAQEMREPIAITSVFNTPGFGTESTLTIENRLIDSISQAKPGSSIRVAMYILDRPSVAKSLVLASNRGVDVQLVLDGRNENYKPNSAIDILLNGFDAHAGLRSDARESRVKFCHGPLSGLKLSHGNIGGSCHGLIINHNKFFLFSDLGGQRKNVVVQTSANIDEWQLRKYNDLVEIDNDTELYAGYLAYWSGLKRDRTRLTAPAMISGADGTRVYTFPRLIGKDPVARLLKRVSCEIPGSIIRASQSDFGRVSIAKQLARLKSDGCEVRVLAVDDPELGQPIKKVQRMMGSSLALIRDRYQDATNSIHTKIVLIDAVIDHGSVRKKIVLTGSHNLDQFSERTNDETLMELHNATVYAQYLSFWKTIVREAYMAKLATFKDQTNEPTLRLK